METGSNIVIINDADINTRNLISKYGILTITDIKSHEMRYIGKQTKKAQNSVQMYHIILKSVN